MPKTPRGRGGAKNVGTSLIIFFVWGGGGLDQLEKNGRGLEIDGRKNGAEGKELHG